MPTTVRGPFRIVSVQRPPYKGFPYYVAINLPHVSPDACYLRPDGTIRTDCCDEPMKRGENSGWFATMETVMAAIKLYEEKKGAKQHGNC